MQKKKLDNTEICTFNQLSTFGNITHFVSTRSGGISDKCFTSLNMGFHVGDDNFRVLQNRRILSEDVAIDLMKFTFANQCHSANVAIVCDDFRGKGAVDKADALANTDGMITNVRNICLCTLVADCVPILLYDPVQEVIGSLHAGWKGTLRKIVPEAISSMIRHYGSKADDIYAALGPSSGPCCYEVGEDVCNEARVSLGNIQGVIKPTGIPGKYIFDQWEANIRQLKEAGVRTEHIESSGLCTMCKKDVFFSARAQQGVTGRFAAGIMLRKKHA